MVMDLVSNRASDHRNNDRASCTKIPFRMYRTPLSKPIESLNRKGQHRPAVNQLRAKALLLLPL